MLAKSSNKVAKSSNVYCCDICDYITSRKSNYDKHILTIKHLKKASPSVTKASPPLHNNAFNNAMTTGNGCKRIISKGSSKKVYVCDICQEEYKSRNGLWKHKKKCIVESESEEEEEKKPSNNDYIQIPKEVWDVVGPLIKNGTHNTNNNNCNNTNTYNNNITVQVYLDEHCKDAKSIEAIVSKLKTQVEYKLKDIAYPSNLKFIKDAPGDLFIKEMKKMPAEERPVHCADVKRGKFWVNKKEEGWVKEDVNTGGSLKTQLGVFKSNVYMDVQDDINKKGKGDDIKYQVAKGKFFKEMFEKTAVDNDILAKLATECNIKDAIKDIEDKE